MLRAASYLNVLRYQPSQRARRRLKVALAVQVALLASLLWLGVTLETSPFHFYHDHSHTSLPGSHSHGPSTHEGDEGLSLASAGDEETVQVGPRCHPTAPVRSYDIVAISVEITLNRYLDYDPQGRMYVLEEDLERVHQEEAQNREARAGRADPAVSLGLQGDAIQPLILRVNQGECLRIALRNDLADDEPVSFHLHGSSLYLADTGSPALAASPGSVAPSSETVTYEWWISESEPEGTHYFHSHGNTRLQTGHGLFGAVIVEPKGSSYLDPVTGEELRSGWAAIIKTPSGSDFREFAVVYHEIGNERYRHSNRDGRLVPLVDPLTSAYKPGGRAINYRSEPFLNRLNLQQRTQGRFDESLAYSSYAFGDPATPVMRSYLGDPVKQRVIHGGSEVFHVHHVHGGAIRWRRQPGAEPSAFDGGLIKRPPLVPEASERLDAQAVGPSETFDVENECGSGGCQQSAGDYLVHCHVAHHYFAGMWTIWRVYNTLQSAEVSQDGLPPLLELPDRQDHMLPAVTSAELIGRRADWKGLGFDIDEENLAAWVERQLPPAGVPKGYDAAVFDWQRSGNLYLGEPESEETWPGFHSHSPGERLPLYFDPLTGKLAYPFLRPHFGKRPPFAPNHGPAPFLEPLTDGNNPAEPGANGPWSLCPQGTQAKSFTIHAITLPIALNERLGLIDPSGQIYVLKEQEEAVRADNSLRIPLAIRANAAEDCVDIVFKSELADNRRNAFLSKANIHIHFVQFDVQASDGVTMGFNFEQSVRPFTVEGQRIVAGVAAGDRHIELDGAERFSPRALVGIGMDEVETFEIRRIQAVEGNRLVLDEPLAFDHAAGEIVSNEFVRYRWYPDVQFGTAYFHDHVAALTSWQHGLFGALIAQPPGSSYYHPRTGEELRSGPIADIHTDSPVSLDISGSFRELVLFMQDDNPLTRVGNASGSSLNLRVEPLLSRGDEPGSRFSSHTYGDPETPILEAYLGDPMVIRGLVPATNETHSLHLDGHWFRLEPFSATSAPINTIHVGISERLDLFIPAAGGPQRMAGDYLYRNGRTSKLREGGWGLIRVFDGNETASLRKLPGRETTPEPALEVCPKDAPEKAFHITAVEAPLPMLGGDTGKVYVLEKDKAALLAGHRAPEPLVLHINVGDCLVVQLSNETTSAASLHAALLASPPGMAAGRNPTRGVPAGETKSYTYFAHPELGEAVALVYDGVNILENLGLGLYGAIVVGAAGTAYTDPLTGDDLSMGSSWRVDAHPPEGASYRSFTLFFQDEDEIIGTAVMPYAENVQGVVGLNYQGEPLATRLARSESAAVFRSDLHGDPATPLLEAYPGDPMKIHVLAPSSEQAHVFSLEGHRWPLEPGRRGSALLSSVQVGALEAITLELSGTGSAGDYLYGDHREPYREAGLWGLLRVYDPAATGNRLRPLQR